MHYLASILHVAIVAALTALTLFAIRKAGARRQPAGRGPGRGRISPGKISAALVVLVALALLAGGVATLARGEAGLGALLVAVALPLGLFMAPSLSHRHDVHWDSDGMSGPDRTFGLTLGWTTTRIAWRDIAGTGRTATGYDYVESRFGTRIYWSYLYPGHGFLEQAIAMRVANPAR